MVLVLNGYFPRSNHSIFPHSVRFGVHFSYTSLGTGLPCLSCPMHHPHHVHLTSLLAISLAAARPPHQHPYLCAELLRFLKTVPPPSPPGAYTQFHPRLAAIPLTTRHCIMLAMHFLIYGGRQGNTNLYC